MKLLSLQFFGVILGLLGTLLSFEGKYMKALCLWSPVVDLEPAKEPAKRFEIAKLVSSYILIVPLKEILFLRVQDQ